MSESLPVPSFLQLARYRITLAPTAALTLPPYKGAVIRGGLGLVLKKGVCQRPSGQPCGRCQRPDNCAYAFLFEGRTPSDTEVLSSSQGIPLPYVLEPPQDTRRQLQPGELLSFNLVLFGNAIRYFPYLLAAFQVLGQQGLGQDRVPCRMVESCFLLPDGSDVPLYDPVARRIIASQPDARFGTDWIAPPGVAAASPRPFGNRVTSMPTAQASPTDLTALNLRFLTPTRLKYDSRYAMAAPEFHVLVRALLRRISSLSYFYGSQRWDIDYRRWIELAQSVEIVSADMRWVDWERYSTRQRQSMNLGGIVGLVTYRGELAPFLPLLRLGQLVHVGKSAVFGNGRYQIV